METSSTDTPNHCVACGADLWSNHKRREALRDRDYTQPSPVPTIHLFPDGTEICDACYHEYILLSLGRTPSERAIDYSVLRRLAQDMHALSQQLPRF